MYIFRKLIYCQTSLSLSLSLSLSFYLSPSTIIYISNIFSKSVAHIFTLLRIVFIFYLFIYLFIYLFLFIYDSVGSSFLCEGFLQLWQAGATLHRGARASHYRGLSCCGAQAPDAQAQYLWRTGPAALRQVGSSRTRARTRVPCIGRQILNHCATREAPGLFLNE